MRLPVAAKMALHNAGAKGGSPGSPTPARRHVDPVGNDPHMLDRRRLVDADDLEAIKVVLLDAAVLEADLAVFSEAQPITAAPSICE
jgi:hypothetical protein